MTSAIAQLIFESPQMAPLALAVAAVALVAMVVLYGPQSRGLDWRWRSGLWVLRCVALLAVAGSIVKPAILRQRRGGEESAAVVVLIDTSRSMGARDYAAATTQPTARMSDATTMPAAALKVPSGIQQTLVALADGLGLLPAGARSGRLVEIDSELNHVAALLDDLRLARQEWEYAQRSARGADLAEARVVTAAGAVNGAAKHLAESTSGAQTGAAASLASALSRLSAACQTLVNRRANPADISRADGLAQTARDAVSRAQAEQDIQLYKTDLKVQSICDDVARQSRLELVERAIAGPNTGLLWRLPADAPVFAFTIGQGVRSIPVATGEESDSLKDLRPVGELDLAADGTRSDLSESVPAVLSRLNGVSVAAVVLFSDGREVNGIAGSPAPTRAVTTATPQAAGGQATGASDVPLFAVLSGPRAGPLCDIAVSELTAPAAIYIGETMHVHAAVTQVGAGGRHVEARLDVDGEPTQYRQLVLNDATTDLDFQVKMENPGVAKISVSVPAFGDEATADNNRAVAWTKVQSGRLSVAMLSSTTNWDQQYLRGALARQPWVKLSEGLAVDTGAHVALTASDILKQDVVMLDDLAVAALDESQWQAVEQVASRQGGGVVMIAGDGHLPAEYGARGDLAALLPYKPGAATAYRTWPGAAAHYHLALASGTNDPAVLEALRLNDASDISQTLGDLPAMFRFLAIPPLRGGARALLVERESNLPVLVEQRLGAGRTIFCGIDQTWRWRFKVGEAEQDRFWLQLLRYAAGPPYAARTKSAWLDADPVTAEPGQAVHVRVKYPDAVAGSAAPPPTIEVWKGNQHVADRALARSAGVGEFAGLIAAPIPSAADESSGREIDYQLRLRGADVAAPLFVWRNYHAELANLAASDEPMRRMAESSGGALLTLDQAASLPERVEAAGRRRSQFVEVRLWDSAYLYLFVLACLSGEWAMRKVVGLV